MTEARATNQRQTGDSEKPTITHVNASGSSVRLILSDGTQLVVAPWSLTHIDAGIRVARAEVVRLSGEGADPEAAA